MTEQAGASGKINAAMGFAVLTAGFACQPETFPVFLAWVAQQKGGGLDPGFSIELARELHNEIIMSMNMVALVTGQ